MSVTANLTAPSPVTCGFPRQFTITLSGTIGTDASFTISDTAGSDTITSTPTVIPAGSTAATFTITPASGGSRTISISTSSPSVTIGTGSQSLSSVTNCPDDSGGTSQFATFASSGIDCPSALALHFRATPENAAQIELYCTTSPVTVTITE